MICASTASPPICPRNKVDREFGAGPSIVPSEFLAGFEGRKADILPSSRVSKPLGVAIQTRPFLAVSAENTSVLPNPWLREIVAMLYGRNRSSRSFGHVLAFKEIEVKCRY
jgi:hypothetical protein